MWILTLRSSTNEPLVYTLRNGKNTIGRSADNDIVIPDDSVSRRHAEIECQAGRVSIKDLGSKNGTFVNQSRLTQPKLVRSGDQVHFGQRMARIFQRNTNPLAAPVDDLSETKPRVRELTVEPADRRTALLYEVANRLSQVPELDSALLEISDLIREAMAADKCAVIQSQQFDQLAALGFSTTIARKAIERRTPVLFPDPSGRPKKNPGKSAGLLHIRTALCLPILIEKEVSGLLYMYRADPTAREYDHEDFQLAVAISRQIALAIQRGRLIEQARMLENWALTDALTGLHNRRQALNLAALEFQRAQSLHLPLTLLMLDIDHFKEINDQFGHPIGDQILKAAAASFRSQLRSVDTLGRYGGDEFVALLVDTGLEGALAIAERLRQTLADHPVVTDRGPVAITISVGVAGLAESTHDLNALLEMADRAMYKAKAEGRNRVKANPA